MVLALLCAGCVGQPVAYYTPSTLPRSLGEAGGIMSPNVRIIPEPQVQAPPTPPQSTGAVDRLVLKVHPEDGEICRMEEPARWVRESLNRETASLARSVLSTPAFWNSSLPDNLNYIHGNLVRSVVDMTAGESMCFSTVADECSAPRPAGVHTCHGVLVLEDGTRIPGIITTDWLHATAGFYSDAHKQVAIGRY